MLIKECHLEKSCYFKDRANQGCVNQGPTVPRLFRFFRPNKIFVSAIFCSITYKFCAWHEIQKVPTQINSTLVNGSLLSLYVKCSGGQTCLESDLKKNCIHFSVVGSNPWTLGGFELDCPLLWQCYHIVVKIYMTMLSWDLSSDSITKVC